MPIRGGNGHAARTRARARSSKIELLLDTQLLCRVSAGYRVHACVLSARIVMRNASNAALHCIETTSSRNSSTKAPPVSLMTINETRPWAKWGIRRLSRVILAIVRRDFEEKEDSGRRRRRLEREGIERRPFFHSDRREEQIDTYERTACESSQASVHQAGKIGDEVVDPRGIRRVTASPSSLTRRAWVIFERT